MLVVTVKKVFQYWSQAEMIALIHWFAYCVLANIFVGIGIVGNVLSIVVVSRPKLKGVMYVYLLGLAVTNLCVLVRKIFFNFSIKFSLILHISNRVTRLGDF